MPPSAFACQADARLEANRFTVAIMWVLRYERMIHRRRNYGLSDYRIQHVETAAAAEEKHYPPRVFGPRRHAMCIPLARGPSSDPSGTGAGSAVISASQSAHDTWTITYCSSVLNPITIL
jgi:hypothetical protein